MYNTHQFKYHQHKTCVKKVTYTKLTSNWLTVCLLMGKSIYWFGRSNLVSLSVKPGFPGHEFLVTLTRLAEYIHWTTLLIVNILQLSLRERYNTSQEFILISCGFCSSPFYLLRLRLPLWHRRNRIVTPAPVNLDIYGQVIIWIHHKVQI